jgi:hypothetical protein
LRWRARPMGAAAPGRSELDPLGVATRGTRSSFPQGAAVAAPCRSVVPATTATGARRPRPAPLRPVARRPMYLAVVGDGPASLAVTQRVVEAGLSVCTIDPVPRARVAMGLSHCLHTVWPSTSVFIGDGSPQVARRRAGVHCAASQAPGI